MGKKQIRPYKRFGYAEEVARRGGGEVQVVEGGYIVVTLKMDGNHFYEFSRGYGYRNDLDFTGLGQEWETMNS